MRDLNRQRAGGCPAVVTTTTAAAAMTRPRGSRSQPGRCSRGRYRVAEPRLVRIRRLPKVGRRSRNPNSGTRLPTLDIKTIYLIHSLDDIARRLGSSSTVRPCSAPAPPLSLSFDPWLNFPMHYRTRGVPWRPLSWR